MSALPAAVGGIAVSRALRVVAGRCEAREDLLAFTQRMHAGYQAAPHHRRIAEALEAVERGETRRLIVTLPPRHGKSLLASQHFPAWFLGRGPDRRIIACSYAASLAYRFSRLARNLLSEPGWPWPEVRTASDLSQVQRWDIAGRRGGYVAAGVGGGITGIGCQLLVIDDPVKNAEEADSALVRENTWSWFTSTAYTRLEPGGRVVVIGTRWNEDDLIGRALAQGGWEHLDMPAIDGEGAALWPERFDLAALEDIRETLGSRMFEALYQQRPGPAEGTIWRREWWKRYGAAPRLRRVELFVDSAFKEGTGSDWSVIAAWGEDGQGSCYLLDLWRGRVEFPELLRAIHDMHAKHRDAAPVVPVVIEDRASGQSALQVLERAMPSGEWGTLPALPVVAYPAASSKVSRAETAAPLAEAGRVFLPADAPWVGDFIEEHAAFPAGRHDDMVDTTAMALHRLHRRKASVGWL